VTGRRFDATDPHLLLWVHACLVESALLFERLTVGRLDDRGRQRFHEEQMLAAELVRLPRSMIPATVPELEAYVADTVRSGTLVVTDPARSVAGLFLEPPPEAEWRPVLRTVARLAFGTLPPELREGYQLPRRRGERAVRRITFAVLRGCRPVLPARFRFIAPYQRWRREQRGIGDAGPPDPAHSLGVRL
jgi:uncharacterized protein (DUF2236 family)